MWCKERFQRRTTTEQLVRSTIYLSISHIFLITSPHIILHIVVGGGLHYC